MKGKSLSELTEKQIYDLTAAVFGEARSELYEDDIDADIAVIIFDKHGQLHWRGTNTIEGDLSLAVKRAGIEMGIKPEERTHKFR